MSLFEALKARAAQGDARAMVEAGRRMLVGLDAPFSPVEGAALIEAAAALENGQAHHQLAILCGAGAGRAQSWGEALDHLQRAASLNWAPARGELKFLADREGVNWRALRRSISAKDWLRARPSEIVNDSPRIARVRGFASARECAWFKMRAKPGLTRATVYDEATGGLIPVRERTNTETTFSLVYADLPLLFLQTRLATALGAERMAFETTKVLHYEPGQEFAPHYDFIETDTPALADSVAREGQRVATALVYLNDGYEGGETQFPNLDVSFKGATGDLYWFENIDASGAGDPRTLHAGAPPTRGEKWVLSQWVREKPSRRSFNAV
ncbi:MAG: prolyl hydroxylase family protein [Hyphomonadaceae bacterium]